MVLGCLAVLAATSAAQPALFHTRLEVSTRGLEIDGGIFRKTIPMAELQVPMARVVDLTQEPGLRPALKIYGVGLPTYRSGWFRLKDGEKAAVALSRPDLAVYVPTTKGYAVLVSPGDMAGFLGALQRPSDASQTFVVEKSH
jgi:hypothetical protein